MGLVWNCLYVILLSAAVHGLGNTDQCSGPHVSFTINADADVKFTVILSLRTTTSDQKCSSEWSDTAIQTVGAIQWAVDRINNASFIDGVKLGFDVYDDCGIERYSINRAIDVVDGFPLGSDACAESTGTACQIGIIGASGSANTAAILDAISGTDVPVLAPFATYPDLSQFTNFYRLTHSEDIQIQAILDLLLELQWYYIAVVYTDDMSGQYGSQTLQKLGTDRGVCVDVIYKISNLNDPLTELFRRLKHQKQRTKDGSLGVVFLGTKETATHLLTQLNFEAEDLQDIVWVMPATVGKDINVYNSLVDGAANKTIVFSRFSTEASSIKDFVHQKWASAMNDSFSPNDHLDAIMACTGKQNIPEWTNEIIEPAVDAVYVLASALKRQQRLYCPGMEGKCANLSFNFKLDSDLKFNPLNYADVPADITVPEFAAVMKEIRFTEDRELSSSGVLPVYDIDLYLRKDDNFHFTKIAEYRNDTIIAVNNSSNRERLIHIPPSLCGANCPSCVDASALRYSYIDGESLILGLFSFHETSLDDPFRCGSVRFSSNDIIIVEAFLHTIDQLVNATGIKFGAVVFDDCYSSAYTELIMTQFLSGNLRLKKPGTSEDIDISKILAAVGNLGSDVTIPLSFLFTKLKIPFISSSSSSPDLDDRINFPYFLRTVPSDVQQARAMVEIMKAMDWVYASALYVNNNYGSKGKEQFLSFANESNICVAKFPQAIPEVEADTIDMQGIFSQLKNQNSKVVMYFGTETKITDFLEVIDNRNDFIFLASEDWGEQDYILEVGRLGTLGSIILKNEGVTLTKDDPFVDYVRHLSPYNNERNPWFTEYWEQVFKCDLPLSFENKYSISCDTNKRFSEAFIEGFLSHQRVIHVINAVEALGLGLKSSREQFCKFENTFPCPNYFKYVADVTNNIKGVTLKRGNDLRVFKNDGNGNVGFEILNVQQNQNQELTYVTVGSYNDDGLILSKSSIVLRQQSFNAKCTPSLCSHCRNNSKETGGTNTELSHTHPTDDSFTVSDYTLIGLLALLIVMMILMMFILVCYFKRKVTALQTKLVETCDVLRHQAATPTSKNYPYVNQNGSALTNVNNNGGEYRPMSFMPLGPSGETLQEWRDAQGFLNGGNTSHNGLNGGNVGYSGGGAVNKAFVGDDLVPQSPTREVPDSSAHYHQRGDNTHNSPDSPLYKPSKSSYGLSTHNSFKRLDPNTQQTSPLKKQPRTQLAVPPCRPELPPRSEHAHRPENLDLAFPSAVPKEKVRKHRSPPRKSSSMSPRELKYTPAFDSSPQNNFHALESPQTKATPTHAPFSTGSPQSPDSGTTSPTSRMNLHGSMEKISRV